MIYDYVPGFFPVYVCLHDPTLEEVGDPAEDQSGQFQFVEFVH